MIIIDNHAHIFPYLGSNSEYPSEGLQMIYAQKAISNHHEPSRRLSDYSIVKNGDDFLWDKNRLGPEGRYQVNFRAGKYGRYEWTKEGIDYFKQYMPVGMQNMESLPEFIIAQMNYIGVTKVVLQHSHIYGRLNNYYSKTVKQFPERFIGLFQINEAQAYTEEQLTKLSYCVNKLGLKGLYFEPGGLFMDNCKYKFYDDIYDPFWKEVDSLSIPLYVQTDSKDYYEQMNGWFKILEKYSSLTIVITLGLPLQLGFKEGKPFIPEIVKRLITEYTVYLEIAYPISIGRNYEYPYQEAQQLTRHLYNTLGANRLIWGSDIPNVERYCTYAQSLNYLKEHCNFISMPDKELILGKNVIELFSKTENLREPLEKQA